MRWWAGALLDTGGVHLSAQTPAPAPDPVLRAMHDEIERSRKLTVSNLEGPYFIQYRLDEEEAFGVSASLGGLMAVRDDHFREPDIQVRVGDYKFDNTNFGGMGSGPRYDLGRFPLDNSYPVMRRYFWLATDAAYKGAVEGISRKRAALRNIEKTDTPDDFAHAEPVHSIRDFERLGIDRNAWTKRVRALSAIFAAFPEIKDSRVDLEATAGGFYLANSEGAEVESPENVTILRVRATAQASDGMTVRDTLVYQSLDAGRMPPDAHWSGT